MPLPFFGIGMKTDLFQSCGHCWVFQICWHIEWNTFTTSSFRIWNNSAVIPSLPLTLFIVILPKADLTSYTWISGSIYLPTISLDLCVHVKLLQLCPTLCDVTDVPYQAPPSMGFSRQEYWSGLPLPTLGDLCLLIDLSSYILSIYYIFWVVSWWELHGHI